MVSVYLKDSSMPKDNSISRLHAQILSVAHYATFLWWDLITELALVITVTNEHNPDYSAPSWKLFLPCVWAGPLHFIYMYGHAYQMLVGGPPLCHSQHAQDIVLTDCSTLCERDRRAMTTGDLGTCFLSCLHCHGIMTMCPNGWWMARPGRPHVWLGGTVIK